MALNLHVFGLEESQRSMWRACRLRIERPLSALRFEARTFSLWEDDAKQETVTPYHSYVLNKNVCFFESQWVCVTNSLDIKSVCPGQRATNLSTPGSHDPTTPESLSDLSSSLNGTEGMPGRLFQIKVMHSLVCLQTATGKWEDQSRRPQLLSP